MGATTTNEKLQAWVDEWAGIFQPDAIEWCDGSDDEWDRLTSLLVEQGSFTRLDDAKRPNSFLCNSCLLYTSPSPRDKRQSRMPSSA